MSERKLPKLKRGVLVRLNGGWGIIVRHAKTSEWGVAYLVCFDSEKDSDFSPLCEGDDFIYSHKTGLFCGQEDSEDCPLHINIEELYAGVPEDVFAAAMKMARKKRIKVLMTYAVYRAVESGKKMGVETNSMELKMPEKKKALSVWRKRGKQYPWNGWAEVEVGDSDYKAAV